MELNLNLRKSKNYCINTIVALALFNYSTEIMTQDHDVISATTQDSIYKSSIKV
jgi:hypothetical protein